MGNNSDEFLIEIYDQTTGESTGYGYPITRGTAVNLNNGQNLQEYLENIDIPPSIDIDNYYTKLETDNKFATKEELNNIDIPDVDLSNYYSKEETDNKLDDKSNINHIHEEYITGNDLLRNYLDYDGSVAINSSKCKIFNYSIKGKTKDGKSVGENEENTIIIKTESNAGIRLSDPKVQDDMKQRLGVTFSATHCNYGLGNHQTKVLFDEKYFRPKNRYKLTVKYTGSQAWNLIKFKYNDGSVSSYLDISDKIQNLISEPNKTVIALIHEKTDNYSGSCSLEIESFRISEYTEGNTSVTFKLEEPLRSSGNIYDEITNSRLIRRINNNGEILESPIISEIDCQPICLYNDSTSISINTSIKPILNFKYPSTTLSILDKHDEDIEMLYDKAKEVFQFVSSGKQLLETSITDKGGKVSKENDIATFNELSNGIKGIKIGSNLQPIIDALNSKFDLFIEDNEKVENIARIIRNIMLDSFRKTFITQGTYDFTGFKMKGSATLSTNYEMNNKTIKINGSYDFNNFSMEVVNNVNSNTK